MAIGAKTIETRSWATSYRGPLAIHAAAHMPKVGSTVGDWEVTSVFHSHGPRMRQRGGPIVPMPLGVVVATCTLADVVPMVDASGCKDATKHLCIVNQSMLLHSRLDEPWPDGTTERIVSEQQPYGDFAPGRYAWVLEDVQALPEPVPARGRQQLWNWPAGDSLVTTPNGG